MKHYLSSILLLLVMVFSAMPLLAQTQSAAVTAENLRSQLRDLQMKEAELQYRLNQLDNDLKPENIERYFAGVGSTRPEELREHRRKQLQLEKDAINAQLQSMATSKLRLESAISQADAQAVQQTAFGSTSLMVRKTWEGYPVLVMTGIVLAVAVVGGAALVIISRRRRLRSK